ncbi:MAG: DAK2 domain-containing protein [Chloroflexi bacterium]|nr:DAK2 domain-containing protein [Chloroflexota bacterium]
MEQLGTGSSGSHLDGSGWAALLRAGLLWLAAHESRINHLNVFPVPDGDTGSNMRLTLEAAVRAIDHSPDSLSDVATRAADAALMGARGNSGVILSLVLEGLRQGLAPCQQASVREFASAWEAAQRAAYGGVAQPREGTMLTAVRAVAAAWDEQVSAGASFAEAFAVAVAAADAAVVETPLLLPVLRDNGVVDAGAAGFALILGGMLRHLRGESLISNGDPDRQGDPLLTVTGIDRAAAALDDRGYCTSYLVSGVPDDPVAFRADLERLGTSLVVASTLSATKVHLHTEHPGHALELGLHLGELRRVEVVNMRDQVAEVRHEVALRTEAADEREYTLVAVVPTAEIGRVFESYGAIAVCTGGFMNPSVEDLLKAVESARAKTVYLLPNNSNVFAAADRVRERSSARVVVIPTRSISQGVAAVIAFLADRSPDRNVEAMTAASGRVVTVEITMSSRATVVDGREIEAGTPIALIDGQLTVSASTVEQAAVEALVQARRDEHSVLTVFAGQDRGEEDVENLRMAIAANVPDLEIEVVQGGQLVYSYIIGME